jgi:hypothetical protein
VGYIFCLFFSGSTAHEGPWPPSGVSIRSYFSWASNTSFLRIISNIVIPSVSWFLREPFSFWGILKHTLHSFLSFGIRSTCRKHRNFSFLIYEILSVALYRWISFNRAIIGFISGVCEHCSEFRIQQRIEISWEGKWTSSFQTILLSIKFIFC